MLVVFSPVARHDARGTIFVDDHGLGGLTEIPDANHLVTSTGGDHLVIGVENSFVGLN